MAEQSDDIAGAIAQLRQITAAHPDHAEAHSRLGIALMIAGQTAEALPMLERACRLDGGNFGYLNNLGLAQFYAEAYPAARDSFARALAINPNAAETLNNMGMTLHKLDDLPAALLRFEASLDINPDDAETLHNYGVALRDAGRLDEAARILRKANEVSGGMPETYAALSAVLFVMGDAKGAVDCTWAALELDPLHVESHTCFKGLMQTLGREDEQYDSYVWACDKLPDRAEVYELYGEALAADGNFEAAEQVLQQAVAIDPDQPMAQTCLGWALSELGRDAEALAAYAKATELAPDHPLIKERYGQTLVRAGRADDAVRVLGDAHRRHPRRSSITALLNVAMMEADDPAGETMIDYDADVVTRRIPVPEGFSDLEAFNEALHAELQEEHKKGVIPRDQTMRGGSQIPNFLFSHPTGRVRDLKNAIAQVIGDYLAGLEPDPDHPFLRYLNKDFRFTDAWSTILYGEGYDGSHTHNGGWLSGVYYVKVPDLPETHWADGEGCIQFGAPSDNLVSDRNRTRRLIRPEPGMLVLFPSYVWHGVLPFREDGVRHSIAFDVI